MKIITVALVSGEWFVTYDKNNKKIISKARFVETNETAIVTDNSGIEAAATEMLIKAKIKELKLKDK